MNRFINIILYSSILYTFCNTINSNKDIFYVYDFSYEKKLCTPTYNAWVSGNCILEKKGVYPSMEEKECWVSYNCEILFEQPLTLPIIYNIVIIWSIFKITENLSFIIFIY